MRSCEQPALDPSASHMCFNQCLDKVRHSVWVMACSMLLGEKGRVSLECSGAGLLKSSVLISLLFLPLHICSLYPRGVHSDFYSFFSSFLFLCAKKCAPKQNIFNMSVQGWPLLFIKMRQFYLGSWFWTLPYLDPGHSAFSCLTCMAVRPRRLAASLQHQLQACDILHVTL